MARHTVRDDALAQAHTTQQEQRGAYHDRVGAGVILAFHKPVVEVLAASNVQVAAVLLAGQSARPARERRDLISRNCSQRNSGGDCDKGSEDGDVEAHGGEKRVDG